MTLPIFDGSIGRRGRTAAIKCLVALALVAGCSSHPSRKPVFPVHGQVTFEGKAVGKATLMFVPIDTTDRNIQPNTETDADGRFTLTSYDSNDGAPAGDYVVTVVWPNPKAKRKKVDPGEDPTDAPFSDQFKGKYWPASASKLRATVKPQPDNEINFVLP